MILQKHLLLHHQSHNLSRGSKKPERSAEAVGSRLLSSAIVQKYIADLARSRFRVQEAIDTVHEILRENKFPRYRLAAAEMILKASGIYSGKDQQPVSTAPIVKLVLPHPPEVDDNAQE